MKSWILALCAAAVVPFGTGCAEEEGDWREPAYPVGVSTPPPPPAPPPASTMAGAAPAPSIPPPAAAQAPESEDVVVGAEGDTEPPPEASDDADPSALTDFHAALDPYGSWVEDPTYGTVWVPSESTVGADFVPYQTAGHWTYDDDYVWASDYEWGWAPFHYGRWVYVAGAGWEWIPGRAYAGAWVSWRYGWDEWAYVGWAPLPPTWCWRRGVAVGIGFVPSAPYAFVANRDLFAPRLGGRFVVGARAGLIGAHTRPWVVGSVGAGLGGRVLAHPAVGGPPPSALHVAQSAVVQTGSNPGVMQARAFAKPAAGGARAAFASSASARPSQGVSQRAVAPAYGPPAPSRYTGRFGTGTVVRPSTTVSAGGVPAYAGGAPRSYATAAPAYRASVAAPAAPTFRSAPSMPAGHAFVGGGSTGGFHSGGGYSGGFHAGGGGFGGYHGGGGGGGGARTGGGHGGGHR